MPEVDLSDPEAAGRDMRLVTVLEDTLREWTEAIEDLLQRELSKEVQEPGTGPLAGLEWTHAAGDVHAGCMGVQGGQRAVRAVIGARSAWQCPASH